jgi:hypothetical protein
MNGLKKPSIFHLYLLVRLLNPREPVLVYDASIIPSLRSHNSQLAGITASDLQLTYIPARFPD